MKPSTKMAAGVIAVGVFLGGVAYAPRVLAGTPAAPSVEQAAESGDQDDAAVLARATVTAEQASAAAVQAYPGAAVSKVALEDENGTPTYGILLTVGGKQLDVKVDAVTGKVVRADDGQDGESGND